MKTLRTTVLLLSLTVVCAGPMLAQSGSDLYQQALVKERAEGDLQGAIGLYRRVVREFPDHRSLAARALVQMGLCYEKLGLTEARQTYRQVIEEFPEQEDEVAVARERLAELTRALAELEPSPRFRKIRIPSNPENGVLSPDGTRLAFSSGGSMWVLPVQGSAAPDVAGEPVRLTEPMAAWNDGNVAAWSADGRWIAFNTVLGAQYGIYVIPAEGGDPVQVPVRRAPVVHYSQFRLSLSPDGSAVAYSAADREAPDLAPSRPPTEIHTVPVAGGPPTRLTHSDSTWSVLPSYSPDGRLLAYVNTVPGDRGSQGQVWVVPREGGTPVQVSDVEGRAWGPIWSPDGRFLAFTYVPGPDSESRELWVVALSEDGIPAGELRRIGLPLASHIVPAGWTAQNEIGLFLSNPQEAAIYTVSATGGGATQITRELAYAWHPRWSPDGSRIYFNSSYEDPEGEWHSQISWVPSGGGEITRLPLEADPPVIPAMPGGGFEPSPDGSTILFFGYREEAPTRGNIWTLPVEGGVPTPITAPSVQDRYPTWSPDGRLAAFLRYQEVAEDEYIPNIFVAPATGGEPRQLTTDDHNVAWAAIRYSPDGRWIAYFTGDRTLSLLPVNGGEPRVLTEVPVVQSHTELAWSPDGRKIAYTGRGSIRVFDLDKGEATELRTGVLTPESGEVHIDWSPDGEKIVFTASTGGDREFWLVSDFFPGGGR